MASSPPWSSSDTRLLMPASCDCTHTQPHNHNTSMPSGKLKKKSFYTELDEKYNDWMIREFDDIFNDWMIEELDKIFKDWMIELDEHKWFLTHQYNTEIGIINYTQNYKFSPNFSLEAPSFLNFLASFHRAKYIASFI